MRVCFFIPRLSSGGAERQCIAFLSSLQHTLGVEAHLIFLGLPRLGTGPMARGKSPRLGA